MAKRGMLHLGATATEHLFFPADALVRHLAAFGSTGSGKTVLLKILIEECGILGIPAILIDSQGDLSSLSLLGTHPKIKEQGLEAKQKSFFDKVEVLTYTPTSSKGIPLSINPLTPLPKHIDQETRISLLTQRASALTHLAGYKRGSETEKAATSTLYLALNYLTKKQKEFSHVQDLIDLLESKPKDLLKEIKSIIRTSEYDRLIRNLKYMTIGENELLFSYGTPLDINTLLGKGTRKTRISIIHLNSLHDQKEKEFFLAMLTNALYQWMLEHPSKALQALFVIDEIAPYLPAGMKETLAKPALRLLYKQARKYGIGCIVSSQNPGDIDYKAFAQFHTWALGRLRTYQDREKIIQALGNDAYKESIEALAEIPPSTFLLINPDHFPEPVRFHTRYLLTEHTTLTELSIEKLTPQRYRQEEKKRALPIEQGLPVSISREQLDTLIPKYLKKQFILFGNPIERVKTITTIFHPYYLLETKQLKKSWLQGTTTKAQTIGVDAITGKMGQLSENGFFPKSSQLKALIGLTESRIKLYLALQQGKNGLTSYDIDKEFGKGFAKKHLDVLRKCKLISYQTQDGERHWSPLETITLPKRLSKLTGTLPLTNINPEETKNPEFEPELLDPVFQAAFEGTELMQSRLCYLPEYHVKTNTRTLRICARSGRLLENQDE